MKHSHLYSKPVHVQYLMAVCDSLAHGEPLALADPPFPESVNDNAIGKVQDELDQACKGGMLQYLLRNSTFPTSLEDLSIRFNAIPLTRLRNWMQVLKDLQENHEHAEHWRVVTEKKEHVAREARLNTTPAQRRAQLKDQLMALAEKEGGYALDASDETLQAMPLPVRNRIFIVRAIASGQYHSLTLLAEQLGVSRPRVAQIVNKIVRVWRHPRRYGDFFQLDVQGGLKHKTTTLELIDPDVIDANGDMTWIEYRNISFAEALGKIIAFLATFDAPLKIY